MNKKTYYLASAVLGLIITTVVVAGVSSAGMKNFSGTNKNWNQGNSSIKTALDSGDYKDLGDNPKITEEKFEKMVEAHKIMENGDKEGAMAIKAEFGKEFGERKGAMGMKRGHDFDNKEEVKKALDNKDYDTWVKAVGDSCPFVSKINQDNFPKLIEAHNLREQARKIMEELGIENKTDL